jgi:hypothetical protein
LHDYKENRDKMSKELITKQIEQLEKIMTSNKTKDELDWYKLVESESDSYMIDHTSNAEKRSEQNIIYFKSGVKFAERNVYLIPKVLELISVLKHIKVNNSLLKGDD